jgi:Tfp pilus assembly protein PilN
MKIQLNLSTSPRANKRPFLAGAALVGVLGALCALFLSHAAYSSWRSNRDLRGEISRLQDQIRVSRQEQISLESYFRTAQAQQVLDRAGFLNSLIGARSFPWTKIFMDLEPILPAGVRVVSISPKLDKGRAEIKLIVGAATDDAKIKFLHELEQSKVFSDIQVQQERRSEQAGGSAPDAVTIELTAWYVTI